MRRQQRPGENGKADLRVVAFVLWLAALLALVCLALVPSQASAECLAASGCDVSGQLGTSFLALGVALVLLLLGALCRVGWRS